MKNLGIILLLGLGLYGCGSISNYLNAGGSTTHLTSSSLVAVSRLRAAGITVSGSAEGTNWVITPTRISGKILSVVLPISGEADDGITPFGDGRPDIAPAQSTLYDFDLSQVTTLRKDVISTKPSFSGGAVNQILLIFGYFDVEFLQGSTAKKIRFCYGDSDVYARGDKLLYNASGESSGKYYWYDTGSQAFAIETGARPAQPSQNTLVRDYSDPIRPEMHYYLLGAQLRNNTDYDGSIKNFITITKSIIENNDLAFSVDFNVQNAVVFNNVSSKAAFEALSDAQLIQKFDMKQNVASWGNSELYCSITFEATPKY